MRRMSFFSWLCVSGMTITHAVAARVADQRQADAGVARCAFDDQCRPGFSTPRFSASGMM